MSTVHDTTNIKPYKPSNPPSIDKNSQMYIVNELRSISVALNATIVALKSIEARIVVGGL